MLKEAIGSPRGLAISTDDGQPVMTGVGEVFPKAEHRECMFHLVTNFKKKIYGKVFVTTFGQQLIHGTNIYLRSIGLLWRKQNQQQLHILGIGIRSCGLGVNFQPIPRWIM